jgi:hypothetical protein
MTTLQERLRGCADSYTPGYMDDTCAEAAYRIDILEAQVAEYKGEAGVMRALLSKALSVLYTIEPECTYEGFLLEDLTDQIEAVLKATA